MNRETFQQRRQQLIEICSGGILLFFGNEESPMNYPNNVYPFRQDSTFFYYWGLDLPGLTALIDLDQNQEIVFGNELTLEDRIWMGPYPTLAERCEAAGVRMVRPFDALDDLLSDCVRKQRKIHFLPPYRAEHRLKITKFLQIPEERMAGCVSPEFIRAVVSHRSIKSPDEIQEIDKALDVSYEMQTYAMKAQKTGRYEREIAGVMEGIAVSSGGRLAFPSIFTVHGEFLHNPFYDNCMREEQLVINDSGAQTPLYYCSDITRTIPVTGKFTEAQRDVYTVVLTAQERAIQAIQPGIENREIHQIACIAITEGLKELGIIKGDVEEAVQAGAHTLFFPHGIGHMLGMDVHDMEHLGEDFVGYTDTIKRNPAFGWKSLRLARELEPGFVVTVEPGVYFIPDLIDQWKAENRCAGFINFDRLETFKGYGGYRIEDDVLVTESGHRVLGKAIPKTIQDVEAISQC